MKRRSLLYSATVFIVLFLIQTVYFYNKIDLLTKKDFEYKKVLLENAEYSVEKTADMIFENLINTKEIRDLLKDINTNSKEQNNIVRQKLHDSLLENYKRFVNYDVQQLHFHTKSTHSFLRFHRPKKFGDDLSDIRATIKYTNKHHKKVKSFEEGRIYSGYRFVYPLFDNANKYIGCVEVSSSSLSFKKLLETDKNLSVDYVLNKKVVSKKVYYDEKNNYLPYPLNNDFFIRDIQSKFNKELSQNYKQELLKSISSDKSIKENMQNKKSFYTIKLFKKHAFVISFIPLKNMVTNKTVGYIVFTEKNDKLLTLFYSYIIQLTILLVFSILIGTFVHKQIILKEKTKNLLDLSENMILVYYKNKIQDLNLSFLNFFKLKNISEFEDKDITKYFIENEKYVCPKTLKELVSILENKKSHIIFIKNMDKKDAFEASIHYIDKEENNFILEFKNVNDFFEKNTQLEEKANFDHLTKLHNRNSFERIFNNVLDKIKQNSLYYSLIMFDIDHFKEINDKFGHNVGDKTLQFLADLIKSNIREKDILCRWGGEEFIILIQTNPSRAVKMAQHLRKAIYHESKRNNDVPNFTCSFGVTGVDAYKTIPQNIKDVDEKLYLSKENGRNQVTG